MSGADIRAFAAETVARFKAPRAVLLCDHLARHPSGQSRLRLGEASGGRGRDGRRAELHSSGQLLPAR